MPFWQFFRGPRWPCPVSTALNNSSLDLKNSFWFRFLWIPSNAGRQNQKGVRIQSGKITVCTVKKFVLPTFQPIAKFTIQHCLSIFFCSEVLGTWSLLVQMFLAIQHAIMEYIFSFAVSFIFMAIFYFLTIGTLEFSRVRFWTFCQGFAPTWK